MDGWMDAMHSTAKIGHLTMRIYVHQGAVF